MRAPLITVIMPAYCAADTITSSIETIRQQSFEDWELLIIDDGSTDRTLELAFKASRKDDRIRVYSQRNAGPSAARNYGIRQARSEFIAFLDADDLWAQTRLDDMLSALIPRLRVGVLFSRTRFMSADGKRLGTLTPHIDQLSATDLFAENPVCSTSNVVCRARVFADCGLFTKGLHHAEDQEWLIRVALSEKWDVCGFDSELFYYRSSDNSQSADLEAMMSGWCTMVDRLDIEFPGRIERPARAAFGPFCRSLARRALRAQRPMAALGYISRGLFHDPTLLFRQPRRTGLTLLGALAAQLPIQAIKERVAR
ncbi:MAG: glycosyltransferase family A protein [Pseudomonadota bacterium]